MNDMGQERIDAHLDGIDAAAEWTPESTYDPRPFRLWWHGLMTYDEYRAHVDKIAALRAEWHRRQDEHVFQLLAEMGLVYDEGDQHYRAL